MTTRQLIEMAVGGQGNHARATKLFGVYRRKVEHTGNLEGREPVYSYVLAPEFGTHGSRAAARRACMAVWDPELDGTSDDHIKVHYDAMARNLKIYKVGTV